MNALTTFAEINFEALTNMHSDSNVLLSFQNLMLDELLEDNQAPKNKEFTVSVQLLITFVTLKQRFSAFFLMCEALPEIYAAKEEELKRKGNLSCNLQRFTCQK